MRFLLALTVGLLSLEASAFVENVVHGYTNCTACHVAPGGGGVLTDYGRSLSKELMSTWGWEGSERPLFGAINKTENIKFGGDLRTMQTYLENSDVKRGRQFLMQKNFELAVKLNNTWAVGTFGTQEGPDGVPRKGSFLSERHYLMYESAEDTRLRIGKFRANFGLNDPNHTRVTKAPLGFGSNSETYNLEFSKFSEVHELFVTATLGRLDVPRSPSSERAYVTSYARYLSPKAKAGISGLFGESDTQRRTLVSLFSVFPIIEHSVVKLELDFQRATEDLFASFVSAGYPVFKGVQPYVFFEHLQSDLGNPQTQETSPGLGLQFLPLPHIEIQAEFKRQGLASTPDKANNIGWLLFHFYL